MIKIVRIGGCRLTIIILLSLLGCAGCRDTESGWLDSHESLYPLKVGNYWVYFNTYDKGASDYVMYYISAHQTIAGKRFAILNARKWGPDRPIIDSADIGTEYLTRNEAGEIWGYSWTENPNFVSMKKDRFIADLSLMCAARDSLGKSWDIRIPSYSPKATVTLTLGSISDSVVLSNETLYGCYRIDSPSEESSRHGIVYRFWYKKGIGMVASQGELKKMTLVAYGNIFEKLRAANYQCSSSSLL